MQTANPKNGLAAITPDKLQWKYAPKIVPPGAQYAMLEGKDMRGSGVITFRIKLPANYQLPPVFSQNPERITVLSGTLNIGVGDKLDTTSGTALPAGSFVVIPAHKHHYDWTSEDTVLQVTTSGPYTIKYVHAKDDPRKNGANKAKPSEGSAATNPSQNTDQGQSNNGSNNPNPANPTPS
jgi:hypothetical protein